MRLANQKASSIIKVKHGRTIAVNTHLMLYRTTANAIALPGRAIGCRQKLGDNKQGNTFGALGRIWQFGQYNMDNIFSQIMLTGTNKDLGAIDIVAAIIFGHRFSL